MSDVTDSGADRIELLEAIGAVEDSIREFTTETRTLSGADRIELLEAIGAVEDSIREFTKETRTLSRAIVLSSLIRMCPKIEEVTPAGRKVMLSRLCDQAVFLAQMLQLGGGTMSQPD